MSFEYPSKEHVQQAAKSLNFTVPIEQEDEYLSLMRHALSCFEVMDSIKVEKPNIKYQRGDVTFPKENKYNAWYVKSEIIGRRDKNAKLFGKTVAVKDNICVAQVPLINGTDFLKDKFTPGMSIFQSNKVDTDAEVVTRVLDAGATISGKAQCEYLCHSASSFTNATGPVLNPYNTEHSSGGSSSGCAVLVATGEVDLAIGGDQGGSIRVPSSWCGIYGMKPTYGLVPFTGAIGMEQTIDHLGPMTRTVKDNALMLEILAGDDGVDPRQRNSPPTGQDYSSHFHGDPKELIQGMKIGVVKEGFLGTDKESDQAVLSAISQLETLGVVVEQVSIPMHAVAGAIANTIFTQGFANNMNDGCTGHRGCYNVDADEAIRLHKQSIESLHDTVKIVLMCGEYLNSKYGTSYYGKAQNLALQLRRVYDEALSKYDVLIMPTTPMRPTKIPSKDTSRLSLYIKALEMCGNTSAFNASGHPAMSAPCGMVNGLPIGMMIIGKYFDERTIYRLAYAFEQSFNWKELN